MRENTPAWVSIAILVLISLWGCVLSDHVIKQRRRIEALERIVGTEPPANMKWTAGHTYTTLVKHSVNCPCVTGEVREVK